MTEETGRAVEFDGLGAATLPEAEVLRFYSEVGRDVVGLGRMLRAPTIERPFVYEIRFDLWPASQQGGLAVLKGFGEDGSVIAFQEGSGLVGQMRGLYSRMVAGKVRFKTDDFQPANYEKRLATYRKEAEYLAAKRGGR